MRLTDKHPFTQKVIQLYEFMESLGISIEYGGNGCLDIIDTQTNRVYKLKDNDTSEQLPYFPTGVEFKLTYEEE